MRLLGGGFLAALVVAAAAAAATSPPLPVFQRSAHAYDKLPVVAKSVGAVQVSRRVATAIDTKKRPYLVYATLMKDKSVCVLLVQSDSYRARCAPGTALFAPGRDTFSVIKGLIGGVAATTVKKVVLVGADSAEDDSAHEGRRLHLRLPRADELRHLGSRGPRLQLSREADLDRAHALASPSYSGQRGALT